MLSYVPWSNGTCGRHASCREARPPSVHVVLTLVVEAECIRAVDAVPATMVWYTAMLPHGFAKRTMNSVVKAINDVFKEGVTLVLPITEGWKKPDYKKRMVNSSKLFEPNVGTWSACGPQLLGVRRCTSSRHRQ